MKFGFQIVFSKPTIPLSDIPCEPPTSHLPAKVDHFLNSPTSALVCNVLQLLVQSKWRIWSYIITGKWDVRSDGLRLMLALGFPLFQNGVLSGGGDDLHQASPGGDIWLAASTFFRCNPGFSPSSCSFFTLHLWFWNKYTCKLSNSIS